jgi:hypothetical protein
MKLRTESIFADPDSAYRHLVTAHRRLKPGTDDAFDAALILLLANHIGDLDVLREAIAAAETAIRDD